MCDPLTIAVTAAVASSAVGAYGAIQSGNTQAKIARYEAAVADNNAIIAEQNADIARERGAREEEAHRRRVQQIISEQQLGAAAGGVEVNSGTALNIQLDTAEIGELDALLIRHNADLEARGFDQGATDLRNQANATRAAGAAAKSAGFLNGVGSIISGVGNVAGQINTANTAKKFAGAANSFGGGTT